MYVNIIYNEAVRIKSFFWNTIIIYLIFYFWGDDMNYITVSFIAVGLAADAFAVSVANGIAMKKCYRMYYSLIFGFYFGLFQFVMPIIGFYMGRMFAGVIENFSNWIAFGLLALIGVKMIYETLKNEKGNECDTKMDHILSVKNMCMLAVATSIDACAVGVSFALTKTPLILPAVIIGVIAFGFSAAGVFIGKQIGGLLNKGAGIIGGVILVIIGAKILLT